ncbi:hypothetical protein J2129_002759 [Methanofollis sp. W23]|uniref:hypothetical protein n=1 Tax=Methanofollis sp. W23 TaxID=2817849 RepID=UPI001AE2587F|nr:hypothetical protein [Methanofollis sp. W23]MBP2147246.1 hypothetical protein [Methanofollis sp. W23]
MDDAGSVGVLVYLAVALAVVGFLYIASGPIIDTLNDQHIDQADGAFPMSQDREDTMGHLNLIFGTFLIFGVLLPLGLYAVIVANRSDDGGI